MKNLILLLIIFVSTQALAQEWENVRLLTRIKKVSTSSILFDEKSVNTGLKDEKIKKQLSQLKEGDEVLIVGKVQYQAKTVESKTVFTPLLIIESIHPVSLKEIGKVTIKEEDLQTKFHPMNTNDEPKVIPLSSDAASAITLTASVLLLNSLTSNGTEVDTKQQLNRGLIFSAGALATGLFIYEQLTRKKKNE